MSLIERLERAQRAAAAVAETADKPADETAASAGAPATSSNGVVVAAPVPANALVPVVTTAVPVFDAPRVGIPVGGSTPSGGHRAPRQPGRDQLIHEVRLRLQTEVVGAFKALLEAKDGDVRATIEPMVDRVVEQGGFARHPRGANARSSTRWSTTSPASGRWSRCSRTRPSPRSWSTARTTSTSSAEGKIERVDTVFLNDQHVLRVIERIIAPLGRRIDESSPRVDARLPDGSRVNAIIEPLSLIGPVITVRKFSQTPFTVEDLIGFGTATPEMFEFLHACIEARLNLFVSGGTGSGKTTTLNVLSSFIRTTSAS